MWTQFNRANRARRGGALISVIFVLVALAGMSAAVLSTSLLQQGSARALHEKERALGAAMSGLDVAFFEIREGLDTAADNIGNATGQLDGGSFNVTVAPPYAGPGEYTLQALGQYGPLRQAVELVVAPDDTWQYGMFARTSLTMSGSFSADSYDATLGTYASQFAVDHAGDQGHLASNGDITAGGGPVWGDAIPGPTFQVLGDPTVVSGSTAPASYPETFDPYLYTPPIASAGPYSGAGALNAGTYRYDSLNLSGGDVLTIDGDVVLYVDDKFTAKDSSQIVLNPGASLIVHQGAGDFTVSGGGIVNPSQLPEDVQIYTASTKKLTLSGGSSFYGLVYGPDCDFVSSGGSELFGVIVAAKATLSGAGWMHFDTSLTRGAAAGFRVKSARRISPVGL